MPGASSSTPMVGVAAACSEPAPNNSIANQTSEGRLEITHETALPDAPRPFYHTLTDAFVTREIPHSAMATRPLAAAS